MAEGKRSEEWTWWSEMLALTANCHRNPQKSRPFVAANINPYRAKAKRSGGKLSVKEFVGAMRGVHERFEDGNGGRGFNQSRQSAC